MRCYNTSVNTKSTGGSILLALEQIREALRDRNLARVSEAVGIPRPTLSLIRSGRLRPSDAMHAKLSDYVEKRP